MAFLYPWNGSSVAIWIPERNCSPRSSSQFLYTVPDLPGTRSTQAGRGVVLPACQVYDAGEFTGPSSASVLVMPHMLINSQYLHACEAGGVIRCGLQTRLDMGPHGIPRGATYPASLKPPEPCRDPGPGCVDHLHHHAPVALCDSARNPGTPPAGCTTQHQAPEYLGCEPRSSDGSPPNRRADHTDHNDQATQSSSR